MLFLLAMVSSLLLPNHSNCGGSRPPGTANNAHQLGMAILYYSHDHNGSCPNKNTWGDDIFDEAGTPKLFISPLDPEATKMEHAWPEKVSSYAFNAAASENQLSYPGLVILFETNLGWNGSGGLEEALGTLKAYDGKPIAVVFADGYVELISSAERLKELMWNPTIPAQSLFENFSEEDEEWEKFDEIERSTWIIGIPAPRPNRGYPGRY